MSNPNPLPGPGRPIAQGEFASWKGYLTRWEWLRVRTIEHQLREPGPRSMGRQSAFFDVARSTLVDERNTIRNRAVKRKAAAERWGTAR